VSLDPNDGGAFQPKRVRRPREQVEVQIRQAILSGEFKVGDRLPTEAELARGFGVSRGTVREALRALATSGLIASSPGATGGSFVEAVDHRSLGERFGESLANVVQLGTLDYDEVANVRRMLEIPSARLAARNHAEEHLQQLRDIIDREKSVSVSDPDVPKLNAAFHRVLADASGNRMLAALISSMHWVTHPLSYIDTSPELGRQSVIHHMGIASAVRDRDEEAAAVAMEAHLDYLREHVAQGLQNAERAASLLTDPSVSL
jgi:GntR family transcriptional regulator, transcriptional repressor for pyruvate dehydrogenase complex